MLGESSGADLLPAQIDFGSTISLEAKVYLFSSSSLEPGVERYTKSMSLKYQREVHEPQKRAIGLGPPLCLEAKPPPPSPAPELISKKVTCFAQGRLPHKSVNLFSTYT